MITQAQWEQVLVDYSNYIEYLTEIEEEHREMALRMVREARTQKEQHLVSLLRRAYHAWGGPEEATHAKATWKMAWRDYNTSNDETCPMVVTDFSSLVSHLTSLHPVKWDDDKPAGAGYVLMVLYNWHHGRRIRYAQLCEHLYRYADRSHQQGDVLRKAVQVLDQAIKIDVGIEQTIWYALLGEPATRIVSLEEIS